jgi:hypothetical protein
MSEDRAQWNRSAVGMAAREPQVARSRDVAGPGRNLGVPRSSPPFGTTELERPHAHPRPPSRREELLVRDWYINLVFVHLDRSILEGDRWLDRRRGPP